MLAEISTPFLKISWVLHKLQLTTGAWGMCFKLASLMTLISFFLCRIVSLPLFLRHCIIYREAFWVGTAKFLFWPQFFMGSALLMLNCVWFYKLLEIAVSRKVRKQANVDLNKKQ